VAGLAVTFVQALSNYKEDTQYGSGAGLPSNVTNVQPVESLRREEPIHGNTPITTILVRTENEGRVGFQGRYVYAGGSRNFVLAEDILATNQSATLATRRQTFIVGKARRDQGSGDFTLTFLPNDRWTISNTTAVNNTRISGDAAFVETTVFTNQFVEFEELTMRHISNATELNFRPVRQLGFYGAYRYSTRRIQTRQLFQFPASEFEIEPFEQNNGINSAVAGFRWQPARGLRVSIDAEAGNADLPFTPLSSKKYHAETARVQWRKDRFSVGASFKSRENDNSASLINHSSTSRHYGVNASWTPTGGKFIFDGGYTKLEIDTASGIFNFFATGPAAEAARSFYTSNLHTLNLGARLQPHSRLTLFLGYNIAKDMGRGGDSLPFAPGLQPVYPNFAFDGTNFFNSFPLTYQSPLARLSISLHRRLSWNFGWQFYGYEERFSSRENYNAHVGYSSFRWSF
jgi:hypothetical protein